MPPGACRRRDLDRGRRARGAAAGARRGPSARRRDRAGEPRVRRSAANPAAPFLNQLAARGALATNYHAVTHPSLPNYLALLGGSTFGIGDDCTECEATGDNLALQLSRAGTSWRAYMGGLPSPCFPGATSGDYAKRHNPFMYFPSIAEDPGRCARVVPQTRLDADLRRGPLRPRPTRRDHSRSTGHAVIPRCDFCSLYGQKSQRGCSTLDLGEQRRDPLDALAAGAGAELGQLAALFAEGGEQRRAAAR